MSPPATEDLLGGKWVIEHELGGGGMGRVVKAHYASTHYPCAIKFLHEQHKGREDLVARFLNEAKLSNRIGHPGVCRVIDVGWTEDEVPYLVMEFLEGESLEDVLIASEGLLPIGEARRICLRVLEIRRRFADLSGPRDPDGPWAVGDAEHLALAG